MTFIRVATETQKQCFGMEVELWFVGQLGTTHLTKFVLCYHFCKMDGRNFEKG